MWGSKPKIDGHVAATLFREGLSTKEIATRLGVTPPTVVRAIYRSGDVPDGLRRLMKGLTPGHVKGPIRKSHRTIADPPEAQYIERDECFRCGARDRKLCGH